LSGKQFLIANEVVSRQEMRHHVGRLKVLVTEPFLSINTKFMSRRREANHCNLTFFSNELQPMWIDDNDRRYMIVRTPPPLSREYYQAVAEELANGGVEALYDYLLHYDLGDFNSHTKPLRTEARSDLVELSATSTQLFWRDLHEGMLEPLPYGPCLSDDLYRAYRTWCDRHGEKMPAKINHFSAQFRAMNGVTRRVLRVRAPGASPRVADAPQRTVFYTDPPQGEDFDAWISKHVQAFRDALKDYRGEH
jgi:putative DNA primase/helicase